VEYQGHGQGRGLTKGATKYTLADSLLSNEKQALFPVLFLSP